MFQKSKAYVTIGVSFEPLGHANNWVQVGSPVPTENTMRFPLITIDLANIACTIALIIWFMNLELHLVVENWAQ